MNESCATTECLFVWKFWDAAKITPVIKERRLGQKSEAFVYDTMKPSQRLWFAVISVRSSYRINPHSDSVADL